MPDGDGCDPFGSPDGRYIVLAGRNGGEIVRILSASKPSEEPTVAFELALGFYTLDEETSDTQHVCIDGITQEEIYVLDIDSKEAVTFFGENKEEVDKEYCISLDANEAGIGFEEDEDEDIVYHDEAIYDDNAYDENNGVIDSRTREMVGSIYVVLKRKDKVCPNMVSEVVDATI